MRRVGRWVRRLAVLVGIAAFALVVAWVWIVPPLVERGIVSQFEAFGLPEPTFRVRGVSPSDLQISDLLAGEEGRFRIGAVNIGYGFSQLFRDEVNSVEIIGLEVEIQRKNGAWDLGPLAGLRLPPDINPESGMPFRRMALRASTLVLNLDGRRLRIPFDGSVESASPSALAIDFAACAGGAALRITGTVNPRSHDFQLALTGDVPDPTTLFGAPLPPAAVDPGRAGCRVFVKADLAREKGVLNLDATARGPGWKVSRLQARETGLEDWLSGKAGNARADVQWETEVDNPWPLLKATAFGRWADGEAIGRAELSGSGALEFRCQEDGPADGWTWSATVPSARATLAPSDLAVPVAGAALEGVRADLRLAANADAEGVRVEVLPKSAVSAVAGSVRHGGVRFTLAGGETPGVALTVGEKPVVASVSLGGPKADWRLEGPDLRLALRRGRAELPDGLTASGAAATARVSVAANPDKVTATLAAPSCLSVDVLTLPAVGLVKTPKEPLLTADTGDKPVTVSASLAGDPIRWSIAAPEARVTLAECGLSLPEALGTVDGLAGAFVFRADADPASAALYLLHGSWLGIRSGVVKAGDETVRVGAVRFTLLGRDARPAFRITREGGRLLSADGVLDAEADGPVTVSAGRDMEATLGTVSPAVEATWGEAGTRLSADVEIGGLKADLSRKLGDTIVAAGVPDARLHLKVQHEWPVGPLPVEPLAVEFALDTPKDGKGVSVAAVGAEATGRLEAHGTLALAGAVPHAMDGRLLLAGASVRHKGTGLELTDITADVPLTWNVTVPPPNGTFAVKSVEFDGRALPPLSGTLGVAGARADFTLNWPVLEGAELRAEGSAGIGPRGLSARAYVSLPLFQVEDEEAMARLIPPLEGMLIGGSFALDGYVRASPDGVSPNISLTVLDGTFRSKVWETEAEGVFATVRINSLQPMLTPRKELQVALVRHARMGKLDVSDGFVAFRLEPKETDGPPTGWTAWVQRCEWGWAGGRLYVDEFRYDPEAAEHTAVVHARDLDLRQLLAYVPNQQASGVGSLDGRLPVTVGTWPHLRFGEGELQTPPGQGGWFRIRKADALGDVLDRANPRFRTDELYAEIKDRLVSAFSNFEYDELRLVFTREDGRFVARVKTSGRGRTGARQEFGGITLNLWGFDSVLRDAILVGRKAFGR